MLHVRFAFAPLGISLLLFVGMLLCVELGRRVGIRQKPIGDAESKATTAFGSGAQAMLALLIGFTFNGAAARFDARRQLVIQVVNSTGTAWQRIDALPAEAQDSVRAGFRRYVDAVLMPQTDVMSKDSLVGLTPAIIKAQDSVWARSMKESLLPSGEKARMLLLPSLNEMFGAVEQERLVRQIHPPAIIFIMLGVTALIGSFFVGYGSAGSPKRSWVHAIGFAATIAMITFVMFELEYPRLGLIRVDAMDRELALLRSTMG
jgi:hypothetical protein